MAKEQPTLGNGKICYLELPAKDVEESAGFYQKVFGWNIRTRGDGSTSFDDGVMEVSGTFVLGRKPANAVDSLLVYIMVDNAEVTILSIVENGGTITQQIGADFPEVTARFADPAGNVLGIYQEPQQ
jgi:predicted enzyme related to lactoylglutathione lyase